MIHTYSSIRSANGKANILYTRFYQDLMDEWF